MQLTRKKAWMRIEKNLEPSLKELQTSEGGLEKVS